MADGDLLVATFGEVMRIRSGSIVARYSDPRFHTVHSVAVRPSGGWVVASAGNDSVLEFDGAGAAVRHWWLPRADDPASGEAAPTGFWAHYRETEDFRRAPVDAFKPHAYHPNRAFYVGRDLWVTCLQTRTCRCLTRGAVIEFPEGPPHDGVERDGVLWFTCVTGHVIAVDAVSLRRVVEIDLNRWCPSPGLLGWCRGIDVVGERAFVGMTMLRSTRHREIARWLVRGRAGVKRPTRVLELDLRAQRCVREVEVGNRAGGTVYAVLADPGDRDS